MHEEAGADQKKGILTHHDKRFLVVWAIGILLLYVIVGLFATRQLKLYKARTENYRNLIVKAATAGPVLSPQGFAADLTEVTTGIFIYRIGSVSVRDSEWTAEFDIWFRWKGDRVQPGKTFQISNGSIESVDKRAAFSKDGEHYERYFVKARIQKHFDADRFPFSDTGLVIEIEDKANKAGTLRYIPDKKNSGYDASGIQPTLEITQLFSGVIESAHSSNLGDPRIASGMPEAHSRYIFAMLVNPPSFWLFIMMFQAVFLSAGISLLSLFIKPIYGDGRFGLGIGAFFAAVGNNIYVLGLIPPADNITLTGMVNTFSLATIALALIQSVISLYIFDGLGREKLSGLFDVITFFIALLCYIAVILALVLAAR